MDNGIDGVTCIEKKMIIRHSPPIQVINAIHFGIKSLIM